MRVPAFGAGLALAAVALAATVPATAQELGPPSEPPPPVPDGASELTFDELGLEGLALRGTDGRAEVFVPRPADAPDAGWQLRLRYEPSPVLEPVSTMTVLAGDTPLQAVRLEADGEQLLVVDVPPEQVGDAGTTFTVLGHLRLRTGPCEERNNPAQYVTFDAGSSVVIPGGDDVYLGELTTVLTGPGDPVTAIRGDLESAATTRTAWQLGRWHAERGTAPLLAAPDEDFDVRLALETSAGPQASVSVSSGDVPTVTLSAPSDEELERAVTALGVDEVRASLRSTRSVLDLDAGPAVEEPSAWADGEARFAELGIDEHRIVGPGTHTALIDVDRPLDRRLARTVLRLDLQASEALTPASVVEVRVNGAAVGTRQLEPGVSSHTFEVPASVADRTDDGTPVRSLDVALTAVLDLPHSACQTPDPAAARLSVLDTSSFLVDAEPVDVVELGRFPAPLTTRPLIVHEGTATSHAAALQVAAAYGRWAPAGGVPTIASLDDVDDGDLADRDLVLLGGAGVLALEIDPPGPVVRGPGDRADAVLAIGASPQGDEQALVIEGDDDGVLRAARLLGTRTGASSLDGRVAALVGDRIEVVAPVPADELPGTADSEGDEAAADDTGREGDEDSWLLASMVLLASLALAVFAVVHGRRPPDRR